MVLKKLTPEQERVIIGKGTEAPFSGQYDNFFEDGIYLCRRCQTPLYTSDSKFDSHCGWPSFDAEISGRVKQTPDPDGRRVEIACAACGAHLGHVFTGEKLTPKDIRQCVNSASLKFMPKSKIKKSDTAVLGGGCFWCLQPIFSKIKGVRSTLVGYADPLRRSSRLAGSFGIARASEASKASGQTENPTYELVSGGATGYAEVIKIKYDPLITIYRELLKIFFEFHDPTTLNRQGRDIGEQYRSLILYLNQEQKLIAKNYIEELTEAKAYDRPIVTEIKPLFKFYPAEEYHQNYYAKHPENVYCQVVIKPKLEKFKKAEHNFLPPAISI